ncbi:hypothetical protein THAOC_16544 [Thalassiosira oceanica]|uniref:Uncharacterized protein n=1 Tax=Thalassiosira oceanica TaxID=159749 RepID=K0SX77_THAOC|nr:hypothetical protein THAOC_16544 [Thalassiosira oceanica]|eukprot:EJK62832.1 hypothetical protein THAOC_16544 [Thalassiosira oceanica]
MASPFLQHGPPIILFSYLHDVVELFQCFLPVENFMTASVFGSGIVQADVPFELSYLPTGLGTHGHVVVDLKASLVSSTPRTKSDQSGRGSRIGRSSSPSAIGTRWNQDPRGSTATGNSRGKSGSNFLN